MLLHSKTSSRLWNVYHMWIFDGQLDFKVLKCSNIITKNHSSLLRSVCLCLHIRSSYKIDLITTSLYEQRHRALCHYTLWNVTAVKANDNARALVLHVWTSMQIRVQPVPGCELSNMTKLEMSRQDDYRHYVILQNLQAVWVIRALLLLLLLLQ